MLTAADCFMANGCAPGGHERQRRGLRKSDARGREAAAGRSGSPGARARGC